MTIEFRLSNGPQRNAATGQIAGLNIDSPIQGDPVSEAADILATGVAQNQSKDYVTEQILKMLQKNQVSPQKGLDFLGIKQNIVEPFYQMANQQGTSKNLHFPNDLSVKSPETALIKTKPTNSPATLEKQIQKLFIKQFGDFASDKQAFDSLMQKVFGENYNQTLAEQYRQKALMGDYSWLPKIEFLDGETLQGAHGAYDSDKDVVYLNSNLKGNMDLLAETYVEEAGHHLDSELNTVDTKGDEGEMFRMMMGGQNITPARLASIRQDNDRGEIFVEGRKVEVEFWNPFKAIGKVFKKVAKAVGGAVKKVVKGVGKALKKTAQAVWKTAKGVFRVGKSIFNFGRHVLSLFPALIRGDWRALTMHALRAGGAFVQIFTNAGRAILDGASIITSPFSGRITHKIQNISDKIGGINRKINDVLNGAEITSHSLFYKGPYLEPWQVKDPPRQTGPKGIATPIDLVAFADRPSESDVSDLAKNLLEKNAPIVRQYANDTYPISTEDMLRHSDNRGTHYDLHDNFTNNPSASHAYTPKTYARANKVNDHIIKLTYTRYYPNSYMSTGPSLNLPGEPEHEGDAEHSIFYYDINKGEIVKANVLKHGEGASVDHTQEQIEFMNGRPVVNVALGSHATGIASGLEKADTKLARDVHRWTGEWIFDNYPGEKDVNRGRAVNLYFDPQNVVVEGVETSSSVTFAEGDRWYGSLGGDKRRGSSGFNLPV